MDPGPRTLDIAYVGTLPPHPGGSAILAAQVLEGLAARGHRVRAVSALADGREAGPDPVGVDVRRFGVPWFEMSPDQPSPDTYRELEGREIRRHFEALVREAAPDVVVVGREIFAWHLAALTREHEIPSVLWVQGGTVWGIRLGTLPRAMGERILREMKGMDRVVAVARHVLTPLKEMGIEGATAVVNGVDVRRFTPGPAERVLRASLEIPDGHNVVLHVSNMKAIKRPLDLVPAAEAVDRVGAEVTWVVLGDGPCLAELRSAVRTRGLERRFRFPGWVAHQEVPDWLRLADVVVMPSAAEAMALVYLETLATGRVLVASDIPAAREVLEDGVNALLFPVGDAGALAGQVVRAVRDPGLRDRVGRAARARSLELDMARAVEAHEAVLLDAVGA